MKIVCLLLLAFCTVSLAGKSHVCTGKEKGRIKQFSNDGIYVNFPCKYHALKRQQCGKYLITLIPSNVWLANNYYLTSIWLSVNDTETGKGLDVRTTNKQVVKHYNTKGAKPLFNKKGGTLNFSKTFDTGFVKKDKPEAYIKIDGVFQLTITPWDPHNPKKHPHPSWEFECFDENPVLHNFTDQVCGGSIKDEVQTRAKDEFGLGKSHADFLVYHEVFTSEVEQTDELCIEAASLMKSCTDKDRRLLVLTNCMDILYKVRHASCVTSYLCSPMEAFNRCLKWGFLNDTAFDEKAKTQCSQVGDAIDLCGDISGAGNITARMKAASCFNDYLPITYDD